MNRRTNSEELHLISCGYEKCTPDASYGPTVRRYYTLHFVLSGEGHFYVNEKHYVIHKNQYFLISPDILTFYKADPENPWSYVWLCFHGTAAPDLLRHCHADYESPVHDCPNTDAIRSIIFRMMEHADLTPANECYIQSGLYEIFARLHESSNATYSASESHDNFYVTQAMNYILDNPNPGLTVTDVADYLHISRSYLFALFKKHLNLSPQQFLTMTRITMARELLINTEIPIAAIADSCGYQNPFAFSRSFNREMHMTPSEYRLKYRNLRETVDY